MLDEGTRAAVKWLERRGVPPISAAVIVCWAIERANAARLERTPWPA